MYTMRKGGWSATIRRVKNVGRYRADLRSGASNCFEIDDGTVNRESLLTKKYRVGYYVVD